MAVVEKKIEEYLSYDKDTGIFTRIKYASSNAKIGDIAGSLNRDGYISIFFNKKQHRAHRLAWLFHYGYIPIGDIDHEDGNRSNNKINNLRKATRSENNQNRRISRASSLIGVLGVTKDNRKKNIKNPYKAQIQINKKHIHIGSYATIELAHLAYLNKKRELHPFSMI